MTSTPAAIPPRHATVTAVIAWALTIATAMWAVGYLLKLPFVLAPVVVLIAGLGLCLLVGGWLFGRMVGRSARTAAAVGLICALPNLLMFGSVIADLRHHNTIRHPLFWATAFVAASIVLSMGLIVAGWALGHRRHPSDAPAHNAEFLLALTATIAAALLVVSGGMVTGSDAGLAVPDWPGSFNHSMFFYPLSKMTGGIYYEHSHRLIGTLVGLMCIVLLVLQFIGHAPRWLKTLAVGLLLAVIAQGVMGGLRVTESRMSPQGIPLARPENETAVSATLSIVHGVCGQLILASLAGLAAALSSAWRRTRTPRPVAFAAFDRKLGKLLIASLIVQLILGAMLRHGLTGMLLTHISFAVVVLALTLLAGLRAWGLYESVPLLSRTGLLLTAGAAVQILLGLVALALLNGQSPLNAAVTTLHQAVGAALLAGAVVQTIWTYRLICPAEGA